MDEIRVGEYIRTNGGNIYQIRKIEKAVSAVGQTAYWVEEFYLLEEDIKAHAKKPIELVEVGDYVNGERVTNIMDNGVGTETGRFIAKEHIDTILTHEMYEQNCYKVGGENE